MITIHIPDFMKQLTTFRTWGDGPVGAMEGFGELFLGQLWDVYGGSSATTTRVAPEDRVKRAELTEHFVELNFMPQDACRWLSPSELRTFLASTLSMIFGNYADKRELQKVFDSNLITIPAPGEELAEGEDFWFDYTADVGDGFDATYTVAALMGQDDAAGRRLSTASCRAARSWCSAATRSTPGRRPRPTTTARSVPTAPRCRRATPQPLMLALPGNHDWYDGLTSFLRLFTQDRMIGGWRTEQKRSYFTVQLPAPLVAGRPRQPARLLLRRPAAEVLRGDPHRQPPARRQRDRVRGDAGLAQGVVGPPRRLQRLGVVRAQLRHLPQGPGQGKEPEPTGAQVRLWLSGDKHHYMRYAERLEAGAAPETARQMVTCRLGGAYLDTTHGLATELKLLPPASRNWREGDGDATFVQQPA